MGKYNCNGSIENAYIYKNIKNNRRYYIFQNKEELEEITVKEEQGEVIPHEELSEISIWGKVAAGALQYAYQEVLGGFVLPHIRTGDEHFILEVDGDSMINADIKPGDYIVIRKQNYAQNMDIIVAAVGEEATLKKFLRSEGQIMLLPENDEYQPIVVDEQELHINGVVMGVVRRV